MRSFFICCEKGGWLLSQKSYNSIYKYHCRGFEMKISEDKMWEAWGRTNALYTAYSGWSFKM